jgi:purine-binding chemotaxis protein CheW
MRDGGQPNVTRLLICRVAAKVCGFPLEHVLETMRPLPIEPLAEQPPFVSGLSIIRSQPTPVVDAGQLLGGALTEGQASRFVLLELGARSVALAVDAVVGVRELDRDVLRDLPGILRHGESGGHLAALGELDSELLVVLEHARLVPDSVWPAAKGAVDA